MRFTVHSHILASAVLALAALATQHAMAQSRVKVDVPFNFVAADKVFPAGTYVVREDKNMNIVTLQGAGRSITWVLFPGDSVLSDDKVSLMFHVHDQTYYLHTVGCGGLVTSRLDKRFKERIPGPDVALLGQ